MSVVQRPRARPHSCLARILSTILLACALIVMTAPEPPLSLAADRALPAAVEQGVQVRGDRISIAVRNAAIRDVLAEISRKAGVTVVLGDGISGEVTLELADATIEEVLKNLCRSSALVYEVLPGLPGYRVIRALAVGGAGESNGAAAGVGASAAANVSGGGAGAKKILSGSSADQPDGKPGNRVLAEEASDAADRGTPTGAAREPSRPLYKAGELLVRLKPGVTESQITELHRSLGSAVVGSIPKLRMQRIRLRDGLAEEAAMALYGASDIVEHVERHALRYPDRTPDDPQVDLQWGLANIHAGEAWDITTGKPEMIVAIIDTGIDYRHPDLQGNIWINEAEANGLRGVDDDHNGYVDDIRGWDFADADNDPIDLDGHGTHVSGIIAAGGNNGLGIAGINWQARIMALKVEADNGTTIEDFAVIEAIQYAIDQGAKIVNCSFGGASSSNAEKNAFSALGDVGGLAVCAAGNDGVNNDDTAHYPSGYPLDNILSVAASDPDDALASFSNYGAQDVDLMAPGDNIISTTGTNALIRVVGTDPIEYAALGMSYAGLTDEAGVTGTLYDCGYGYSSEFPAGVRGNIALIKRGSRDSSAFYFVDKVKNAQTAGAIGVIVYDNKKEALFSGILKSNPNGWVPTVLITQADGSALLNIIATGQPVITLFNEPTYGTMSGTSMAAPHVTGVAGLLRAQCPSLSYLEIRSALFGSVDKIQSVTGKLASGGRLNAFAALDSVLLPGDLTGDCRIGLGDAILALQVLSGEPPLPAPCPACKRDVTGDDRIGLQEAIFILQKTAALR